MRNSAVIFIYTFFFLMSCQQQQTHNRKIERSFYFWKSVFRPGENEKKLLVDLRVKTLYLKFFDVDWDNRSGNPLSVAQIRIIDSVFIKSFNIIPVVFITNNCIRKITATSVHPLAHNISGLIKNICSVNNITASEIQIDCDWTESTRDNFFNLLRSIREEMDHYRLSCTIRLHQVKYSRESGIPPVDRGLLMVYNMGNLKNPASKNSILDIVELKKYISNLSDYPLPLDAAFPLFEWKVLFRDNLFSGLVENLDDSVLNLSAKKLPGNRYQILKDTVLEGYNFKQDDILRKEESDPEEVVEAARLISGKLPQKNLSVALFHLDSIILKKYTAYELEAIFNCLH